MNIFEIGYLKKYISQSLRYDFISKLQDFEYIHFVGIFFITLNNHRKKGLKKDDLYDFLLIYIKEESKNYFEDDIFEKRFVPLTEELICFCPSPFFWDIPLEEYMKKWERLYFPNL